MHSELKREEGRRCNVTRSRQMNALAATILKTGRGGEKKPTSGSKSKSQHFKEKPLKSFNSHYKKSRQRVMVLVGKELVNICSVINPNCHKSTLTGFNMKLQETAS